MSEFETPEWARDAVSEKLNAARIEVPKTEPNPAPVPHVETKPFAPFKLASAPEWALDELRDQALVFAEWTLRADPSNPIQEHYATAWRQSHRIRAAQLKEAMADAGIDVEKVVERVFRPRSFGYMAYETQPMLDAARRELEI